MTNMMKSIKEIPVRNELALDFFAAFARFEFALKASTFVTGNNQRVLADWDKFGKNYSKNFISDKTDELKGAVEYLLKNPPKKQVFVEGHLEWKDSPPDKNLSELERVILMVRRVRNNLMHGGKFAYGFEPEISRDNKLIESGLLVLNECILFDEDVKYLFFNE